MTHIKILGCGSSCGVPQVCCDCEVCCSSNPKNKRLRASLYITTPSAKLLIDTSPDLRMQALTYALDAPDAILFTHAHADHTHGIDDIRGFNVRLECPLPAYMDSETKRLIEERFDYVCHLLPEGKFRWYKATIVPQLIKPFVPFNVNECEVLPIEQGHGKSNTLGFRIGNFAYSTDLNYLSEKALSALENLDLWIVGCLRKHPSPTHATLDQILEWVEIIRPKRTILTHMAHELEYESLKAELPHSIEPAFDGMEIEIKN